MPWLKKVAQAPHLHFPGMIHTWYNSREGAGWRSLHPRESPHCRAFPKPPSLSPGKLARKRPLLRWLQVDPSRAVSSSGAAAAPSPTPGSAPERRRRPAQRPRRPQLRLWFAAGQVNSSSRSWMNNERSGEGKPRALRGRLSRLPQPAASLPPS